MYRSNQLLARFRRYSIRVIRLGAALPNSRFADIISRQIIRSATSPGAQYAEARRAKSNADFISKIEGALQELEETGYWLRLIDEMAMFPHHRLALLIDETDQLIAILTTIVRRTKQR